MGTREVLVALWCAHDEVAAEDRCSTRSVDGVEMEHSPGGSAAR
jgi:hypothetical protein